MSISGRAGEGHVIGESRMGKFRRSVTNSAGYMFIKEHPFVVLGIIAGLGVAAAFTAGVVLLPGMFYVAAILGPIVGTLAFAGGAYNLVKSDAFYRNPKSWRNAAFAVAGVLIVSTVVPVLGVFVGGVVTSLALGFAAAAAGKWISDCIKSCSAKWKNRKHNDGLYDHRPVPQQDALYNNNENQIDPNALGRSSPASLAARFPADNNNNNQVVAEKKSKTCFNFNWCKSKPAVDNVELDGHNNIQSESKSCFSKKK